MILPILTYIVALLKRPLMTRRLLNMNRWKDVPQRLLNRKLLQRLIESQIFSVVQLCLHKKLGHEIFDSYFEVLNHSKNTRNSNLSLRLSAVKLEIAKQDFSYRRSKAF